MALKNTYAKLPAGKYIQDIQDALIKVGAEAEYVNTDNVED